MQAFRFKWFEDEGSPWCPSSLVPCGIPWFEFKGSNSRFYCKPITLFCSPLEWCMGFEWLFNFFLFHSPTEFVEQHLNREWLISPKASFCRWFWVSDLSEPIPLEGTRYVLEKADASWVCWGPLHLELPGVGGSVVCAIRNCPWSLCFKCVCDRRVGMQLPVVPSAEHVLLTPFCPPCLPSSSCRWHEHPHDQGAPAAVWSWLTWGQLHSLQARIQWGEELRLLLGTHWSFFQHVASLAGKDKVPLCGNDKWQTHA